MCISVYINMCVYRYICVYIYVYIHVYIKVAEPRIPSLPPPQGFLSVILHTFPISTIVLSVLLNE
jgi:hypothetical protein